MVTQITAQLPYRTRIGLQSDPLRNATPIFINSYASMNYAITYLTYLKYTIHRLYQIWFGAYGEKESCYLLVAEYRFIGVSGVKKLTCASQSGTYSAL